MEKLWTQIEERNAKKVKEMCETKLQETYQQYLAEKITKKDYEKAGGYRRFQTDLEMLNMEYTKALRKYDKSEV